MTQNINKEWIENLRSSQSSVIVDAINKIAEKGNSAYFPHLIELLQNSEQQIVKDRILKLLCEIKHRDVIPYMIQTIQDPQFSDIREQLVTACWENGLDFTAHIDLFTDLVITGDYMLSLEAFTLVENMEGDIQTAVKEQQVEKINAALKTAPEEKKPFLEALVQIIPNIVPPQK